MRNFLIISTVLIFGCKTLSELVFILRDINNECIPLLNFLSFFFISIILISYTLVPKVISIFFFSLSYLFFLYNELSVSSNLSFIVNLLEHAYKITLPLLCILYLNERITQQKVKDWLLITFGIMFIGHGLYATSIFTEPKVFEHIIAEYISKQTFPMVYIAVSDILMGCLLLFAKSIRKGVLVYMFFWTTLATAARALTFFPDNFDVISNLNYIAKILWRIIYITTPLFLMGFSIRITNKKENSLKRC